MADSEANADELKPLTISQTPIANSKGNIGRNMYSGTSKLKISNKVPMLNRPFIGVPFSDQVAVLDDQHTINGFHFRCVVIHLRYKHWIQPMLAGVDISQSSPANGV